MATRYNQVPLKEKQRVLALVNKGRLTIHKGASQLGIPYTTIISRIYRGSTLQEAFMKPIRKRDITKVGNAAWQALGDEAR